LDNAFVFTQVNQVTEDATQRFSTTVRLHLETSKTKGRAKNIRRALLREKMCAIFKRLII
jgi:hypothetical protein